MRFARLVAADDYQSAGIDLFLKELRRTHPYVLDDGAGTGYAGATYVELSATTTCSRWATPTPSSTRSRSS